ncbi:MULTISPECIES: fimbrial protein [Cupriavidus]
MKRPFALLALLSAAGLLAASPGAFAECRPMTPAEVDSSNGQGKLARAYSSFLVQFPATVEVDPDLGINEPIATGNTAPIQEVRFIMCIAPSGSISYDYFAPPRVSSLGQGIYETGVPGVGFRLSYVRASGRASVVPYTNPWTPPSPNQNDYVFLGQGATFRVELIKTSNNMPSRSVVQLGQLASIFGDVRAAAVGDISVGSVELKVLPNCRVDSSTLNIEFGPFGPADVSATAGPTQPVDFTVRCSGPTPPATITATLAGTPDGDDPRLIRNTGATNLAIRLADRATSYILKPNDGNSALTREPHGAMESGFSLDATVLRVGSQTPAAGRIQATATVTLSIL